MNRLIKHMKYLLIILPLSLFNYASAYTMPVGIPEASLDFTLDMPERPSDWSVEVPGYYYVDYQNGVTSQTYGTPTLPRKTFPAPALAGSYIEIAGEYTQGFQSTGNRMYTFNGTDDVWNAGVAGPIWVTGAKDTYGAISMVGFQIQGMNIYISDLAFINNAKIQISSSSDGYYAANIVVRNVDISGGGISVLGDETTQTDNIVLYNNTLHDFGDIYSTTDDDNHLVSIGKNVSNVWVLNNLLHTASGAGLQVLGSLTDRGATHNIYVGGNEVYDVRQSGMWLKAGTDVVFSSNIIRNVISTSWSPSKGMGAQYVPDNFWMINNHISGVQYGIRIASTSSTDWVKKIYSIGNIIHNVRPLQENATIGPIETTSSWQSAAIHIAGADEHHVLNNLIFDAPNGIDVSTSNTIMWIKNNILLDVTAAHVDEPTGYHIMLEYLSPLNGNAFIENNYFGDGMYVRLHEGVINTIYNTVESLNDTDGSSGNISGTNIITASDIDALMESNSIEDYDLSALEDAGTNVDDILLISAKETLGLTTGIDSDVFDMQRVQEDGIDIGPFEQDGASRSEIIDAVPNKPGNLQVIKIQ